MQHFNNILILLLSLTISVGCGASTSIGADTATAIQNDAAQPKIELIESIEPRYSDNFRQGDSVVISCRLTQPADSILLLIDGRYLSFCTDTDRDTNCDSLTAKVPYLLNLDHHVGQVIYTLKAYRNNLSDSRSGQFTILPRISEAVIRPTVLREYPHDRHAYTQGLLIHKGRMYESTGEYGSSTLRHVDPATGRVSSSVPLARDLFGEGLAVHGDKLYQLTWMEGKCLVYNIQDLAKIKEFDYQGQGWGLTTVGDELYLSDGSNVISVYEPENFTRLRDFEVYDTKGKVAELNELEYIDGRIWANIYTSDMIAVIDPRSGAVTHYIDCTELADRVKQYPDTDVFNGIAYDADAGRVFVTGKNWDRTFEIKNPF